MPNSVANNFSEPVTAKIRRSRWEPQGAWNLFILALSVYVIFALVYKYSNPDDVEANKLLGWGDSVSCVFFFWDFVMRWLASPDRLKFWIYGWIDLLSCVPNVQILRVGRLAHLLRMIRIIRALRAGVRLADYFVEDRKKSVLAASSAILFFSVLICALVILKAEEGEPSSGIDGAFDAFWWSVNVVTTVGAGGNLPISVSGKVASMFLMFVGIGLFSMNAAVFASWIIGSSRPKPTSLPKILAKGKEGDKMPKKEK